MLTQIYEQDFYTWLNRNAELLRQGRLAEIDTIHLAEELESMGKSQRQALTSRLAVLLMHLLKWQYEPQRRCRHWELTIIEQRREILELLEDSPSLKHELAIKLTKTYQRALIKAERETGIAYTHFPATCPYSLEQILSESFYPI
jgi:hypothetical protein